MCLLLFVMGRKVFLLQLKTKTFYIDHIYTYNIGIGGKMGFIVWNTMIVNPFFEDIPLKLCRDIPHRAQYA